MIEKVGRYEILEEIGEGGFAIVYRARDTTLDRQVALKELKPVLLRDTDWVRRFRREARTIASLDYPHIVSIHDVTDIGNRLFLVMRLIDGPGLDELISKRGGLSWTETVDILRVVARGLDYAHDKGILHRDLKPSNILMDPERGPMLTDFGLAKLAGESSMSMTAGGNVVGTPQYIAPEVWEAQGTSRQSDIYALGCILYEMLIGEKVFRGKTPPEVMMAHFKPPVLPEKWPAGIPSGVTDVLNEALAKSASERYATAGEMVEALAALPQVSPAPHPSKQAGTSAPAELEAKPHQRLAATPTSELYNRQPADEGRRQAGGVQDGPAFNAVNEQRSISSTDDSAAASLPAKRGSSGKWRGFMAHLGPYIIIITMLAFINMLTGDQPWFLYPAAGWGAGLAFHLMGVLISELNINGKWRSFLGHFGSYAIVISMLGIINLISGGSPWFLFPAAGWGAAVAIHLGATIFAGGGSQTESGLERHAERRSAQQAAREQRKEQRHAAKDRRRSARRHSGDSPAVQEEFANSAIRARLDKAHAYREQIEMLIKSTSDRNTHTRLQALADQVGVWTQAIENLAKRVDRFQQNTVIHHDLESVPGAIEQLEVQLAQETNAAMRGELEQALVNRKNQLAVLENLQNTMRRAEIKIENTLSSLGTIYSQLLSSQSTDHVADYGRLAADVDEEVRTLQDHLEALEEVKLGTV